MPRPRKGESEIAADFLAHRGAWRGNAPHFLGSLADPDEASLVLVGAPFDGTTSFLPGTRMAPNRIREASVGLETYSPFLDRSLEEIRLADLGDLELPFGNVSEALEMIEAACRSIVDRGTKLILLGGEHLVTLPAVRACHSGYPDLAVVQFDAHADLRADYMGEHDSHATVMRRIGEVVGSDSIFQLGIRSGTREEFAYGRAFSGIFQEDLATGVRKTRELLGERPVYVTVDIDVVDPGFAPGTGTPEPGGCRPQELFQALWALEGLNIVGFDVVEVNPLVDSGVVTSILAAKIVREAAILMGASDEETRATFGGAETFGR